MRGLNENHLDSPAPESAAWRLSLLSHFSLDKLNLAGLSQPVLVIASEAERLFPSGAEADRLVSCLPNAQKTFLPKSSHACLLEREIQLEEILRSQDFSLRELLVGTSVSRSTILQKFTSF